MQIYADILNLPIKVAATPPSSALGSAVYAAAASGYFETLEAAAEKLARTEFLCYTPNPDHVAQYEAHFHLYKEMHDFFGIKNPQFMKHLSIHH